MKKGYCEICGGHSGSLWTLVLAEYDSLKVEQSTRIDLCGDCARKISNVLRMRVAKDGHDGENVAVIVCPTCREKVPAGDPKAPRPCPKCSAIFSGYSAWKTGNRVVESVPI